MSRKVLFSVLLMIGLTVTSARGASEFTGAVDSNWYDPANWTAGIPLSGAQALIGTITYPGVSALTSYPLLSGGISVGNGANGTLIIDGTTDLVIPNDYGVNTDVLTIGASGGSSVTATATISGDVTVNGYYFVVAEDEAHSIDIGGGSRANVIISAGARIETATNIGVGMNAYWSEGYATTVYQGPGSTITINYPGQTDYGLLEMGLNHSESEPVHYIMDNARIYGGIFHAGGTLEIRGQNYALGQTYRARSYAGEGNTILKLVGENSCLYSYEGLQLRGVRLDVSEYTAAEPNTWEVILDGTEGDSLWQDKDIDFVPGTDPNWELQIYHDGRIKMVWLRYNGDQNDANEPFDLVADIAPVGAPDGIVDGADLGALLARWKDTGESIADIAPVGAPDGIVDGADLGALLARWKDTYPASSPAVPEPTSLAVLSVCGLAALYRRRRR